MAALVEYPISLDRTLTTLKGAMSDLEHYDNDGQLNWLIAESLSDKPSTCAITTVDQLRSFLKPALQSPVVTATHTSGAPFRSVLGYSNGNDTEHHIVITQDTIWDHGSQKICALNHRLGYYLTTALGSTFVPFFADNSFDTSAAAYIRCRVQGPNPRQCDDIFRGFSVTPKKYRSSYHANYLAIYERVATTNQDLSQHKNYVASYWKWMREIRKLLWQGLGEHGGLTAERRNLLRREIQKVPIPQKEVATIQDALDGYAEIRKMTTALFQTTVGRLYFWGIRQDISASCEDVTEASPHKEGTTVIECSLRDYSTRKTFVTRPLGDVGKK